MLSILPILLMGFCFLPTRWCNRNVSKLSTTAFAIVAVLFGESLLVMVTQGMPNWLPSSIAAWLCQPLPELIYVDNLSGTMAILISFIGAIILRFSLRYLDGEPNQGKFVKWISVTLGSVLMMVLSGNLLLFAVSWVATSFSLHRLLTHYSDRPEAIAAARQKFFISRFGDAMIFGALILAYVEFGTVDYPVLFEAAEAKWQLVNGQASAALAASPVVTSAAEISTVGWGVSCIGILLVLGAMAKSAQFPLHIWLPETMETPTPVSALMHAGIINAGGFLIIRLNPLVMLSPIALDSLIIIGGFTAVFGAMVAMTQTSVKRSLAFSTIAQMGFMLLQCGLGAFGAALLHIVAHSLYKAHAFLSSGSVVDNLYRTSSEPANPSLRPQTLIASVGGAIIVATGMVGAALLTFGLTDKLTTPSILLVFILTLALVQLFFRVFSTAFSTSQLTTRWAVLGRGITMGSAVVISYSILYMVFNALVQRIVIADVHVIPPITGVIAVVVACGFIGLFATQIAVEQQLMPRGWRNALYVHAINGFYIDTLLTRLPRPRNLKPAAR